jgi:hypothetical protein
MGKRVSVTRFDSELLLKLASEFPNALFPNPALSCDPRLHLPILVTGEVWAV